MGLEWRWEETPLDGGGEAWGDGNGEDGVGERCFYSGEKPISVRFHDGILLLVGVFRGQDLG